MNDDVAPAPTPVPAAGAPPSDDVLVARAVTKIFGGLVAVSDIDFSIPRRSMSAAVTTVIGLDSSFCSAAETVPVTTTASSGLALTSRRTSSTTS